MNKILLLCVDYNSHQDSIGFVNSVLSMHSTIEIVLVLNSGKDRFENEFISQSRLYVYDSGSNLGYMQGAFEGLKFYLKDNNLPDWIILSNTDISFPDKLLFDKLSNDFRYDCIIAPDIISQDGVHQNPFLKKRISKQKLSFLVKVNSHPITAFCYNFMARVKNKLKSFRANSITKVDFIYAPHGSFVIIGSDYFKHGQTLEHPKFLYGEELLIAERASLSGIKVIYDDSYHVRHAEHITTGKMPSSFRAKTLKESLSAIIKEYY